MLPIHSLLPELLEALENHPVVLLQAPPGAGKTTGVPPALLDASWRRGRRILVLEPRRLAARAAARFMARSRGEEAGATVGYRTRLDSRVSAATRIEVVTEGILTRLIQADPSLEEYAAVVFDEFHERSLQADLGLALVRESQQALRPDLKILVMSATLDTAPLARLLDDAPVLSAEGRSFPVDVHYRPARRGQQHLADQVAGAVRHALKEEHGSILVFLPGIGEIRQVARKLAGNLPGDVTLNPLYGQLSPAEQDRAIAPAPADQRKLVLATAIAESSLTIEGIRVVIDGGLERQAVFDPNSGMTRLVTMGVSRAAADQRKGRAGRLEPGVCYRLWSASAQAGLTPFTQPEILAADLAPLVLDLALWGARDPADLTWLDPPPRAHWDQAAELLRWLGALDDQGGITAHGRALAQLGVHPRLAHMLVRGRDLGMGDLAAELAALLSERDFLGREAGADLETRVRALRKGTGRNAPTSVVRSVRKLMTSRPANPTSPAQTGRLLSLAWPDRIARRRPGGRPRYQLSNGRGAFLEDSDPLSTREWLVAADLDGQAREARIYLGASLEPAQLEEDLADRIRQVEKVGWDESRGALRASLQRRLGALVLSEAPGHRPGPEAVARALLDEIRRRGMESLPWTEADRQWLARVEMLRRLWPAEWPAHDSATLESTLDQWLEPFLAGLNRWRDVENLDLRQVLQARLDRVQQKKLKELAPTTLTVPAGTDVGLDYRAENGPALAVKLQAIFGWTATPVIARGRLPVTLHLLSPAGRPLAITADLASFWQQGYPQVRKDMRGRYPKHPWPEDPLTARASLRTRHRKP